MEDIRGKSPFARATESLSCSARPVIAINNQWPSPTIRGNIGDTVTVNVKNNLGNETLTIHWHGIFQTGNNANDGTPMVAQCPIIPGASYTYTFHLEQPGTYWYHSHSPSQYMDGLRGPLIIHDPKSPYAGQYDEELIITVSDWYWDQGANLEPQYLSIKLNQYGGSEPVPLSALMNDQTGPKFSVQPNKTYFLRIINISGFSQFYFHVDNHNFTIIEADGVYMNPQPVDDLYIATGQRYGCLLKTLPTADQNYPILGAIDVKGFDPDAIPANLQPNVTAVLMYNATKPIPSEAPIVNSFHVFDDFGLVPQDGTPLLRGTPDQQIVLALSFFDQSAPGNEQYRAGFNNITYIPQKVPSLYTVLSAGKDATNPKVYDGGPHPLHIHGHNVQLVARSNGTYSSSDTVHGPKHKHHFLSTGIINSNSNATAMGFSNSSSSMPAVPMRRDTWMVAPNGYTVIRFIANNPGTWFLHCHMEWHMDAGLLLTLIEAPLAIQSGQPNIPSQMQSICKAQSIPLAGNAAGNSQNFIDLHGQIKIAPLERGALV
ncbi:multicopper oxidase [Lepidopterella palustris CBS 459.81]|uniref:Multicopper oxidase n=1 Tax=Lepidopterella palustris CBS 459.81 TaxID=1314670 RepID=A0A8E2E2S1_9PEZI|nr:multicopper oxidase [Lepidopterella palustris CBS 459.81]